MGNENDRYAVHELSEFLWEFRVVDSIGLLLLSPMFPLLYAPCGPLLTTIDNSHTVNIQIDLVSSKEWLPVPRIVISAFSEYSHDIFYYIYCALVNYSRV